ncbi:MAG: CinA family protein [Mycoplasma sp.]
MINQKIFDILNTHNENVFTCESFTLGKLGYCIGIVPGSSKTFYGSMCIYQKIFKNTILNNQSINVYSQEYAQTIIKEIANQVNCRFYISTTGNAGPISEKNNEIGKYYYAFYDRNKNQMNSFERKSFKNNRESIINDAIENILNDFLIWLEKVI